MLLQFTRHLRLSQGEHLIEQLLPAEILMRWLICSLKGIQDFREVTAYAIVPVNLEVEAGIGTLDSDHFLGI